MNANELADRIEKSPYAEYKSAKEAATMLRQQQAEIEALKKQRNRLETLAEQMLRDGDD